MSDATIQRRRRRSSTADMVSFVNLARMYRMHLAWDELRQFWGERFPDRQYASSESMKSAYFQAIARDWERLWGGGRP